MIALPGRGRWSGKASFDDVVRYVVRASGGVQPVASWCWGVTSVETGAFEMEAAASQSVGTNLVYHLIVSWAPEERPSVERARESIDYIIERMGLGGLQQVSALHDDGASGHLHGHSVINLYDVLTKRARSIWRHESKMREACREVEMADGWRVVGSENVNERGQEGEAARVARAILKESVKAVAAEQIGEGKAAGSGTDGAPGGGDGKGGSVGDFGLGCAASGATWSEAKMSRAIGTNATDLYGMRRRFRSYVSETIRPKLVEFLSGPIAVWEPVLSFLREHQLRYEVVSDVGARIVGAVSGFGVRLSDIGLRHRQLVEKFGEWLGPVASRRRDRDESLRERVDAARSVVEGLDDAAGWVGVDESLQALRLGIEKRQNGLRLVDLDSPSWVKISRTDPVLSLSVLRERFGEYEAGRGEVHRDAVRRILREAQDIVAERQLTSDPSAVLTTLLQSRTAVPLSEVRRDVARRVSGEAARENVTRAVVGQMVALSVGREVMLTSAEVIAEERAAAEAARTLGRRNVVGEVRSAVPSGLTAEQERAYRAAVGRRGTLKLVMGLPEGERAALVSAVAEAYRAGGYRVRVLTPMRERGVAMTQATTVPVRSLGLEVHGWARSERGGARLGTRDLVILDDAGSVGTEYGAALLREASRSGAVVIALATDAVGRAVGRGDALRIMRRAVGERAVDVGPAVEFSADWRAAAHEAVVRGQMKVACEVLSREGKLIEQLTDEQAVTAMVARWRELELVGIRTTLLADRDSDRRELGAAVRAVYRALGGLTSADVVVRTVDGLTPFAVGDRVLMRESVGGEVAMRSGEGGVVWEIADGVLSVERSDGRIVKVDPRVHPGIQYAYATSEELRGAATAETAELALLSKQVSQRRLGAAIGRPTREFAAYYSRQRFKKGISEVIDHVQRSDRKLLVIDGVERGPASVVLGSKLERELAHERGRGAELGVEVTQ